MSYEVLARRLRPRDFSEVVGQAHVLASLKNALDRHRLHHAYLFAGTRGVGKTTLARIMAKCLNCDEGPTSRPCGTCSACEEIRDGRFIDLIEVDAASRTKVEDTRELLENVQYTPTRGRFKIYLIDEVHMLSRHSFNALLKTLEEPPPHVKFLFATTDPQKLPVTILSRCLQFNLKHLSPRQIVGYLSKVLEQENVEFDEAALWQLAVAAAGSMRDALTLVDQVIVYCEGRVTTGGVIEMLGVPEQQQVHKLLEAMAARDVSAVIELVAEMAELASDFSHTLDGLLSTLHRIAVAQVVPKAADNSLGDKQQIMALAGKFSAEDVQLYYQLGSQGRPELHVASEAHAAFEMLLLRMLVFSPDYAPLDVSATGSADAAGGEPAAQGEAPGADAAQSQQDSNKDSQAKPEVNESQDNRAQGGKARKNTDGSSPDNGQANKVLAEPPGTDRQQSTLRPDAASGNQDRGMAPDSFSNEQWLELFSSLPLNGVAAGILANSRFERLDGETFHFTLDQSQSALLGDEVLARISGALSKALGRNLQVHIEPGDVQEGTPSQQRQERRQRMEDDFRQDSKVQELIKHFSARLVRGSIEVLGEGEAR